MSEFEEPAFAVLARLTGKVVVQKQIGGRVAQRRDGVIMNATNTMRLAGGGPCGASLSIAGHRQLQEACHELG